MSENKMNILRERCPQKHICKAVKNCPAKAITQEGKKAPEMNKELCNGCGTCASLCPKNVFIIE